MTPIQAFAILTPVAVVIVMAAVAYWLRATEQQ